VPFLRTDLGRRRPPQPLGNVHAHDTERGPVAAKPSKPAQDHLRGGRRAVRVFEAKTEAGSGPSDNLSMGEPAREQIDALADVRKGDHATWHPTANDHA
jgi:hypothetical protein